jgi:tetratricopeptide (TPR) repeat protein
MRWTAALWALLAWQSNFYTDGVKALNEKRYPDAVKDFTNAVAAEPNDYTAHFNLALAYSLTGQRTKAAAEYRKTLELKPGLFQAELNLGIVLLGLQQTAAARDQLAAAVSAKPQDYRANYFLGDALLKTGDAAGAEKAFTAAVAAQPNSAAAELGLGRALAQENKLDEAAPHFRKAASLDPQYHDSLLELAQRYEASKRYAEAAALYGEFPDDPAAIEHRGEMLMAGGNTAAAVQQFEQVVAKSPTDANRAALADAYLANKQSAKALPLIEDLLQHDPNNFQLQMLSASILRDQRNFKAASEAYARAAQLRANEPKAWTGLAEMLLLLDDYTGTLNALDRVRALQAETPGHMFLRAVTLDKMHDLKPALASYKEFLAASQGKFPDEEFKARQRVRIIQNELNHR